MDTVPKVGNIDDEDNILTTKIKLTKNEYNATIKNKLEYNRLKVINRHLDSQCGLNTCKIRTSMHDLKKWLGDNQRVVCNIDEFFRNQQIQSAAVDHRSRLNGVQSSLSRIRGNRKKSASILSRPFTAPLQLINEQQNDIESDDEIIPVSISRAASSKLSIDRIASSKLSMDRPSSVISSSAFSHYPVESILKEDHRISSSISSTLSHRITWPIKLKVCPLQDEKEARQEYLTWRAEQRKNKPRPPSTANLTSELEQQYQQSIRRRQEIEAYVTPELIEAHKIEDPIFAKRYQQLKVAIRSGKVPTYDSSDCEIHVTMTKSKIERARSALITAKQSKIKTFYRDQQTKNNRYLSERIQTFLERIKELKKER